MVDLVNLPLNNLVSDAPPINSLVPGGDMPKAEQTGGAGILEKVSNWLFGEKGKFYPASDKKEFPSEVDRGISQGNDLSYGDKSAPYLKEGTGAKINMTTGNTVVREQSSGKPFTSENVTMDPVMSNYLHRGWLAARESPVAQLGFDIGKMKFLGKGEGKLTDAGGYYPGRDEIWSDTNIDTNLVHESMHRGLKMLKDAGLIDKGKGAYQMDWNEETLVRGLMLKHFGKVEMGRGELGDQAVKFAQTVLDGDGSLKRQIERIEKAASEYLAQKHPGGPR